MKITTALNTPQTVRISVTQIAEEFELPESVHRVFKMQIVSNTISHFRIEFDVAFENGHHWLAGFLEIDDTKGYFRTYGRHDAYVEYDATTSTASWASVHGDEKASRRLTRIEFLSWFISSLEEEAQLLLREPDKSYGHFANVEWRTAFKKHEPQISAAIFPLEPEIRKLGILSKDESAVALSRLLDRERHGSLREIFKSTGVEYQTFDEILLSFMAYKLLK